MYNCVRIISCDINWIQQFNSERMQPNQFDEVGLGCGSAAARVAKRVIYFAMGLWNCTRDINVEFSLVGGTLTARATHIHRV